jgi:phosphoesterase RecJ-like protein
MSRKIIKDTNTLTQIAEQVSTVLKASRRILVASHIDPDGDAIGTQLAFAAYLRDLGKEVFLVRQGDIPHKYRFLSGVDDIPHYREYENSPPDIDTALILECPNVERIGQASELLRPGVSIVNIDHHFDNSEFGAVNWIDSKASSVGEMAYEYFQAVGFEITQATAEQLYTAILTDTGRFRFSSTTPRTMEIAGELIAVGAHPQRITDLVYFDVRSSTIKLVGKVLNNIEFLFDGRICILTQTRKMLEDAGAKASEVEGVVDYTLHSSGVIAGALLKENGDAHTRVSFRSKDGINVAAIAARFGGGGHFNASGCTIPMPIEEARQEVIRLFTEALNDNKS